MNGGSASVVCAFWRGKIHVDARITKKNDNDNQRFGESARIVVPRGLCVGWCWDLSVDSVLCPLSF